MCEKPAGVYTKQVREMNEAAAKSNRFLCPLTALFTAVGDRGHFHFRHLAGGDVFGVSRSHIAHADDPELLPFA